MADDATMIAKNIITAIDTERTDVICSVLSELRKNPSDSILLHKILNESYTEHGTFLHYATKLGKIDKVRALLAGGADPGIHNKDGQLPLDFATEKIRTVYNEELLKATAQSNLGRVCQLLAAGVSIHLVDSPEMMNTPLHWAACHGNRDIVQCLCARGATPNAINARGLTPLHEAVKRGDAGIVEELLNYDADPTIQVTIGEDVGQTCIDLAEGKESILQAFRAPRDLLDPMNNIKRNSDNKANYVRLDSTASNSSNLPNGIDHSLEDKESASFQSTRSSLPTSATTALDDKLELLWPPVQSLKQSHGQPFLIREVFPVFIAPGPKDVKTSDVAHLWNLRRYSFNELDLELSLNLLTSLALIDVPHVICHVNKHLSSCKGSYKLTITHKQVKIICGSLEALNYAISTILQLLSLFKDGEKGEVLLPTLLIDDYPNFLYRGVLLDISQGRIRTMTSMEDYIEMLSNLKFNQIYFYTRFQVTMYPGWQCSYTRSEILHLTDFCEKREMQLIPLIEVGPKVQFQDMSQLYPIFQDFLSCFGSTEFVSAGPRLSSFLLDATEDCVSVADVLRFIPIYSNQTLQLCGYPLHDLPSSFLQQLHPGLIFKEYSVKADHDYDKVCAPLAEQGMNCFVCPGTAAWNSIAGCPEAAVNNIAAAAACNDNAIGLVVCDWSGKGHLNHFPFSWPGVMTASGLAWNKTVKKEFILTSLPSLLNNHIYKDEEGAFGKIVMDLGKAETYAIREARNQSGDDNSDLPEEFGSILYRFLTHPDGVPLEFLSTSALQHITRVVKKSQEELSLTAPSSDVLKNEVQLSMDLMLLACRIGKALILMGRKPNTASGGFDVVNFGISNLTATTRTDLANRLLELIQDFQELWSQRSMTNIGLDDSLQRLQSLLKVLIPNSNPSDLLNERLPVKIV